MKNLLMIAGLAVGLFSCEKEVTEPSVPLTPNINTDINGAQVSVPLTSHMNLDNGFYLVNYTRLIGYEDGTETINKVKSINEFCVLVFDGSDMHTLDTEGNATLFPILGYEFENNSELPFFPTDSTLIISEETWFVLINGVDSVNIASDVSLSRNDSYNDTTDITTLSLTEL